MTKRDELATSIAGGLGGWLQMQAVQKLSHLSGEDSARLVVCQIIRAQANYVPIVSALPQNWGNTKKRVDIALKGRAQGSSGWYGAIEVKWPGVATDWHIARLTIVQDVMRLVFIETANLNAKFMVVGGSSETLQLLFDKVHPESRVREDRRQSFAELLSRDTVSPNSALEHKVWSKIFPGAGARVPPKVFDNYTGKMKTQLLAKTTALIGESTVGSVYVWHCLRSRPAARPRQIAGPPDQRPPGAPAEHDVPVEREAPEQPLDPPAIEVPAEREPQAPEAHVPPIPVDGAPRRENAAGQD